MLINEDEEEIYISKVEANRIETGDIVDFRI